MTYTSIANDKYQLISGIRWKYSYGILTLVSVTEHTNHHVHRSYQNLSWKLWFYNALKIENKLNKKETFGEFAFEASIYWPNRVLVLFCYFEVYWLKGTVVSVQKPKPIIHLLDLSWFSNFKCVTKYIRTIGSKTYITKDEKMLNCFQDQRQNFERPC